MDKPELGRFGEEQAVLFLKKKGCRIIKTNFRCRLGEIDIIAADSKYIIFTEVKLRKNTDFGSAAEFVTKTKQRKIKAAAAYYLAWRDYGLQPRFDVIEIYAPFGTDGEIQIDCIENAFW